MIRKTAAGLFIVSLFVAAPARANVKPETTKYAITIKQVDLRSDAGDWITVIRPDRIVDLINEEPVVSFFNNAGKIPEGKYVNFRIVLSEVVSIAGCVQDNCTLDGGKATLVGSAVDATQLPGDILRYEESAPTWQKGGVAGTVVLTLDLHGGDDNDDIVITSKRRFEPIEIKAGSFVKVWFDVDLKYSIEHAVPGAFGSNLPEKNAMFAMPPALIEELRITSDDDTRTFPSDQILIQF